MFMHILYIHQYFGTPRTIGAVRSYEFALRWLAKGHKITMLTSTCNLSESDLSNTTGKFFKRCVIEGIDIVAMKVPYKQQMGVFRRLVSFFSFFLLSSFFVLFLKKVDVVYATSTPLTVGAIALVGKWFRRLPYVFEVRDQWPEPFIERGVIRNKIVIVVLLWLERIIYKYSSAIVALSPGMAKGIREVLDDIQKPITVVPNCSDINVFRPEVDGFDTRKKYGWNDKLVFLHAGAMGRANGLDFVIEIARKLKAREDIHFVLLGKGKEKQFLQKTAKEQELKNVEFLDFVPRLELSRFYAACDVSMVIFENYRILEDNSANKFFNSLSSGKPVLLNYSGWQREVLEKNKAGFGCRRWDMDEFVDKVLYFNSHREQLLEMGRNARKLAVEKYPRDKLAIQALETITSNVNAN
jgi:glycosyltransferase involved in cell wall biosynthesis